MHHLDLILTLTGGLAAALVCGYLTHRLGLSPIVGYLWVGLLSVLTRLASLPTEPWRNSWRRWELSC